MQPHVSVVRVKWFSSIGLPSGFEFLWLSADSDRYAVHVEPSGERAVDE